MKIKAINYRQYFIDSIKVNWKLPIQNLTMKQKLQMKDFYDWFYSLQKNNGTKYEIAHTLILPKDAHYNIRGEWFGRFWSHGGTKMIKHDIMLWYDSFLKMDEYIQNRFKTFFGHDHKLSIHTTISRLDIARNHKGNLQDAIPIHHPNITNISNQLGKSLGKPYITGIAVGKRTAKSGTFFRAYDKRFDLDGLESSLLRFGTADYVRKEWELKRKTLRRFNIVTPSDLVIYLRDPKKITEIIYRLRKVQDCILRKDTKVYNSIHDLIDRNRINPTEGYTMTGQEFNKMLKKDYKILLNKANPREVKRHFWNPFKQVNSLIEAKGQYLEEHEMLQLITKIIGSFTINEVEVETYENRVQRTLDVIKKDKRIKTALKDIENKKREINHYTKSLMNKE